VRGVEVDAEPPGPLPQPARVALRRQHVAEQLARTRSSASAADRRKRFGARSGPIPLWIPA
jgi:hypothetical protein